MATDIEKDPPTHRPGAGEQNEMKGYCCTPVRPAKKQIYKFLVSSHVRRGCSLGTVVRNRATVTSVGSNLKISIKVKILYPIQPRMDGTEFHVGKGTK